MNPVPYDWSERMKLYVVKIVNAKKAPPSHWYKRLDGTLQVCYFNEEIGVMVSFNPLGNRGSSGFIGEEFYEVVNEFEYNSERREPDARLSKAK